MRAQDIFNNYGNFFMNGTYSDGKPILYKLCFFIAKDGDDFAIFQRVINNEVVENNYCIGHNNNFNCKDFTVNWCWGHYDFNSYESAKEYIKDFYKNKF